ncbi:hypothetical protein M0802_009713 [Mischocyttarus mexicanus]|nr:hypothetical protein M0802_009713 [Mischocyttarus mexicanus]
MEPTERFKIDGKIFKSRLTRLEELLDQGKLDPIEMKLRFEHLAEKLDGFQRSHIDRLSTGVDENEFNDFDEISDRYFAIEAKIRESTSTSTSNTSTTPSCATTACATTVETPRLVTPPCVEIPKFDGNLENWITYKDEFTALVGSRTDISEVEKTFYLRESLIGEAQYAIPPFSTKEDCYKFAWEALLKRYDRKRLLLTHHIDMLLATQRPEDDDVRGITRLLKDTRARIQILTSLNLTPLDIVTRVIENAIPEEYLYEWYKRLHPDVFPSIEEKDRSSDTRMSPIPKTIKDAAMESGQETQTLSKLSKKNTQENQVDSSDSETLVPVKEERTLTTSSQDT